MKLLTKLGSCWQSPPHHSTTTASGFEQEHALNPQPKRRISSSAHWQPALTAISEDYPCAAAVVDERRGMKERARPPPRKAPKRASRGRSDYESSWKVQAQIAIPAFSPVPFVF